jgi:hypothetical protein
MAQEWLKKYLTMKPEVNKVFDDLEAYHNYCRFELCDFNPAHLYDRSNVNYKAFLDSQRPARRPYLGNKPRWDNNGRRNEQNFSR